MAASHSDPTMLKGPIFMFTRFDLYSALGIGVLYVSASSMALAQNIQDEFHCQLEKPGAQVTLVRVANGELFVGSSEMSMKRVGPIQITDASYVFTKNAPLLTDGTGSVRIVWALVRTDGTNRYEVHASAPTGSSKPPLDIVDAGRCWGFNPPGSGTQNVAGTEADPYQRPPALRMANNANTGADEVGDRQADTGAERQSQTDAAQQQEQSAAATLADQQEVMRSQQERADAERIRREEDSRLAIQKAETDRKRREEDMRLAREKALAQEKLRVERQRQQDEQGLIKGFSGRAATCPGGGSGVYYLQTSHPIKKGCNVQFEARCPGTSSGSGVTFSQYNYIGGSCFGIGDLIRIGEMSCPPEHVQISMTNASCG